MPLFFVGMLVSELNRRFGIERSEIKQAVLKALSRSFRPNTLYASFFVGMLASELNRRFGIERSEIEQAVLKALSRSFRPSAHY